MDWKIKTNLNDELLLIQSHLLIESIKQNKTGLVFFDVLGYNILGIHGEEKDLSQAIKDYQEIYNTKIDYILAGHKHHASFQNCGVRKGCVGIGSLIGVDGFSMSIKKLQMLLPHY